MILSTTALSHFFGATLKKLPRSYVIPTANQKNNQAIWIAAIIMQVLVIFFTWVLGSHLLEKNDCFYCNASLEPHVQAINIIGSLIANFLLIQCNSYAYHEAIGEYRLKHAHYFVMVAQVLLFIFDVKDYTSIHVIFAAIVCLGNVARTVYHIFFIDPKLKASLSTRFRQLFGIMGIFYTIIFVISYSADIIWLACGLQWIFLCLFPLFEVSIFTLQNDMKMSI